MNSIKTSNKSRIIPIILFSIILSISGCDKRSDTVRKSLDLAESLMESHPDSALSVINSINDSDMTEYSQKARFSLLKSMALDKNYIDTTTFDILQPAINYYIKKGSPDERLRTYYYMGRIYQNRNELDSALHSFIKALDNIDRCRDSLTIARTLVAQSIIYESYYDFDICTNNYLKAAQIYRDKSLKNHEFDCLFNALDGMIILENKEHADEILKSLISFKNLNEKQKKDLVSLQLSYLIQFGSYNDLKNFINNNQNISIYDGNDVLSLALAYNKIGFNVSAKQIFNYLDESNMTYDTLKYLSIKYRIIEDLKESEQALLIYKDFVDRLESINSAKFEQKSQSIEERHQMELQAERDAQKNFRIVCVLIGGVVVLILVVIILALVVKSNKTKKVLAMQKVRTAELENDNLKSERERLTLENANLQLERDKKVLEAENLAHRVEVLEGESESLKALLETAEEIPAEVQQAIKTRIEMLNSLLAGYITDNSKYEEPYDIWVKQLTDNTAEFMNSNRLAFQASHPKFIRYFEEHDLTESEINYVCLYAIGLRGKEVGNYMKKRSHVNISSAIRKKLGIDKHDTNIGIYVRKLLKTL
ncbi:MAG: hypothetical protein K2I08_03965 [Muribaculaceae bacterium]|nr:hypothetical protein [Muribaculaceae bacterium]